MGSQWSRLFATAWAASKALGLLLKIFNYGFRDACGAKKREWRYWAWLARIAAKEGERMAESSLGRKTLSTFVAATLVVSLNVPMAAWADSDGASGDAAAEQTQSGTATAGAGDTSSDGTAQAGETAQGAASENAEMATGAASAEEEAAIATASATEGTFNESTSTYAASVGDENYSSLAAAITVAATSGQTVKLLNDVTESVSIGANQSIVLDLNDHSITSAPVAVALSSQTSQLTVVDTGVNKKGSIVCTSSDGGNAISNGGKLTLNGGTFSGGKATILNVYYGAQATVNEGATICASAGGYGVYNDYNSVLTINGGTFEGSTSAAVCPVFGTLSITGGTFSVADNATAIVSTESGLSSSAVTATISGGTFTANNATSVLKNASSLNISGGTFTATGTTVSVLDNSSSDAMTIENAVFNSTGTAGQLINNASGSTITIKSGKFTAADASTAMIANAGTVTVAGGSYSGDISGSCTLDKESVSSVVKGSDGTYVTTKWVGGGANQGEDVYYITYRTLVTDGASMDKAEGSRVSDLLPAAVKILRNEAVSDNKLGEFTLDLSDSAVSAAYENVKSNVYGNSKLSVVITLLVRTDTYVDANENIVAKADEMDAADVIPFAQSLDMLIEVKDGSTSSDGELLASATIPVTKIDSSITTTVSASADKVKAKVDVAHRASDNTVSTQRAASVDYETGAVTFAASDFSTPDFAYITVAAPHASLVDYTNADGSRKSVDNSTFSDFGYDNSYAFAGWYKDPYYETACSASDVSGTVFPKFVEVAELIDFKGGSLRMDQEASVGTSLRFGYETRVPASATLKGVNWSYNIKDSSKIYSADMLNKIINDDSITANLVLVGAKPASYNTTICVSESVTYTTVDGTEVTATEVSANERSIAEVAKSIVASDYAPQADKTYAQQILDAIG